MCLHLIPFLNNETNRVTHLTPREMTERKCSASFVQWIKWSFILKHQFFLTWLVNDNYLILINFLEYRLHFSQSWCLSKGSTIRILQGHVSVVTKHETKLLFYVFSLWMYQKFLLSNLSLNLLNQIILLFKAAKRKSLARMNEIGQAQRLWLGNESKSAFLKGYGRWTICFYTICPKWWM